MVNDIGFNMIKVTLDNDIQEIGYLDIICITKSDWKDLIPDLAKFKEIFYDLDNNTDVEWAADYFRIFNFFVNKPTIDYSYIDIPFRNKDFAEKLYKKGLDTVRALGFDTLYSDNILSSEAEFFWNKLVNKGLAEKFKDRYRML